MKNKKQLHLLQHELELLQTEMALAMQNANTEYVAKHGRSTTSMDIALLKFIDWARRYEGEGK